MLFSSPEAKHKQTYDLNLSPLSNTLSPERASPRLDSSFRSGSGSARKQLTWQDKQEHLKQAEELYKAEIEKLEVEGSATTEEIQNFKKAALIKKSVENVKQQAQILSEKRHQTKYTHVQSKVAQNMRSQELLQQLSSERSRPILSKTSNTKSSSLLQRQTPSTKQASAFGSTTQQKRTAMSPSNTVSQEELKRIKQTSLREDSLTKLSRRDAEIRQKEAQLEAMMQDLNSMKTVQDKLAASTKYTNIYTPLMQEKSIDQFFGDDRLVEDVDQEVEQELQYTEQVQQDVIFHETEQEQNYDVVSQENQQFTQDIDNKESCQDEKISDSQQQKPNGKQNINQSKKQINAKKERVLSPKPQAEIIKKTHKIAPSQAAQQQKQVQNIKKIETEQVQQQNSRPQTTRSQASKSIQKKEWTASPQINSSTSQNKNSLKSARVSQIDNVKIQKIIQTENKEKTVVQQRQKTKSILSEKDLAKRPLSKTRPNKEAKSKVLQKQEQKPQAQAKTNTTTTQELINQEQIEVNRIISESHGSVEFTESRQEKLASPQHQQKTQVIQTKKKQGINSKNIQMAGYKEQKSSQKQEQVSNKITVETLSENKKEEHKRIPSDQVSQQYLASGTLSPNIDSGLEQSVAYSEGGFGALAKNEQKQRKEKQSSQNIQIATASGPFLNKELEQRTKAVQDEFEILMAQLQEQRQARDGGAFYEAHNEYYYEDPDQAAHESPTRRLVEHKNTTFTHKQTMKDNNVNKGEYHLTYTTGVKNSYVIEPHCGELNYKLAEKDPLKFYDEVFNQDITQHKVKVDKEAVKQQNELHRIKEERAGSPLRRKQVKAKPLTVTSKVTKRPQLNFMVKLKEKIEVRLREKLGEDMGADIKVAMQDKAIDQQIKSLVKQDKLKIVDEQNKPVYDDAQIKKELFSNLKADLAGVGAQLRRKNSQLTGGRKSSSNTADEACGVESDPKLTLSENDESDEGVAELQGAKIFSGEKTKTKLSIASKDFKLLEVKVRDLIRRGSTRV